jgi:phage terminase Nu1 subunit (DNA packaging protein)
LLVTVVVAVAVWGALFLLLTYRKLLNFYQLTNQRFIHKEGILRQVSDRIEVIDMDDVTYEQTIIDRMLSVGTIRIASSDRSHPLLCLRGIDDVHRIADLIDDVRRKERRKRGLHIETI